MQVFNFENQGALLTALETHLLQGLERVGSEPLWCECGNGLRSLFYPEQLQEIGGRVLGVHADFSQRHVHLLDDGIWVLRLAHATVMAEHINEGMVRNTAAIGETASFKIGHPLVLKVLTKFVQESGF